MSDLWNFILAHQDTFWVLLGAVISIVKMTSWGQAKSDALDSVVQVIEQLGLKDAKSMVASQSGQISKGAEDALNHAVQKADPKKRTKPLRERVAMEVLRGIIR